MPSVGINSQCKWKQYQYQVLGGANDEYDKNQMEILKTTSTGTIYIQRNSMVYNVHGIYRIWS
jgi:hypothetical protein